jgi:hypothetical protein
VTLHSETKVPQDIWRALKFFYKSIIEEWVIKNKYFIILLIIIGFLTFVGIFVLVPGMQQSKLEEIIHLITTTVIQTCVALAGLLLVAITLAWNRAQNAINELGKIRNNALSILCGDDASSETTVLEKGIEEYYNECTDSKRVLPNFQPQEAFITFGALLSTVAYYRPPKCSKVDAYNMVSKFAERQNLWRFPLTTEYKFFDYLLDLMMRIYSNPQPNLREIYNGLANLDKEYKINNKLEIISFYYSLSGVLFRGIMFLLILSVVLSTFLLISSKLWIFIFDAIIVLFFTVLLLFFKLVINVIDTID